MLYRDCCSWFLTWPPDGSSRQQRRDLLGSGHVQRIGRSVALDTRAVLSPWWAALAGLLLRMGPDAQVTGAPAAVLWGLDELQPGPNAPIAVRIGRSAAHEVEHIVRTRHLSPPVPINGWAVAPIVDMLVDLGRGLPARLRWLGDADPISPAERVELALESALRRRLCTVAELRAVLTNRGTASLPGARLLTTALDARGDDSAPTESHLETRMVQIARRHRLPIPSRQVEITEHGRFVARVDLVFGDVIVELDGREFHADRFQGDRARWDAITRLGRRLLVFTADDVERRGRTTCQTVRDTMALAVS